MNDSKFYAGIGSRVVPNNISLIMYKTAYFLSINKYILRSGGANGSDSIFESGAINSQGKKEIYLPWKDFNNSKSNLIVCSDKAFSIAENYHPYWHNLKPSVKKLHARNSHQILGQDLNTLVEFVLCYTKNGKRSGGTGQALRIAEDYKIKIFDFGLYEEDLDLLKTELKNFLELFL